METASLVTMKIEHALTVIWQVIRLAVEFLLRLIRAVSETSVQKRIIFTSDRHSSENNRSRFST